MTKIPRIDNQNKVNNENIIKLYDQYSQNCVVCSRIPNQINKEEICTFLSQFGEIIYLWVEEKNGQESYQSMIIYKTEVGVQNAINCNFTELPNYNQIIIFEPNRYLMEFSKKFIVMHEINKADDLKQYTHRYSLSGIMIDIQIILWQISPIENWIEQDLDNDFYSYKSDNNYLIVKFVCFVINRCFEIFEDVIKEIEKHSRIIELIDCIRLLCISNINQNHIRLISLITQECSNETKSKISKKLNPSFLSQLMSHTNNNVQQLTIKVLFNILNIQETRINKRKEHPLNKESEKSNLITKLLSNYSNEDQSNELEQLIVQIIGKLYRGKEIQQDFKEKMINDLKSQFIQSETLELQMQVLDILCGLAMEKQNITIIASNNFAQILWCTIQQIIQTKNNRQFENDKQNKFNNKDFYSDNIIQIKDNEDKELIINDSNDEEDQLISNDEEEEEEEEQNSEINKDDEVNYDDQNDIQEDSDENQHKKVNQKTLKIIKLKNKDKLFIYSLELLLLMCENGDQQLENDVRLLIGDYILLEVIDKSDIQLEQRVISQLIKWNNNEQLQTICKIIQIKQQFDNMIIDEKLMNINEEQINIIHQSLISINNQITNQLESYLKVSDLTMKLIKIICSFISNFQSEEYNNILQITQTEIPFEIIKMLQILPLSQIKPIHFKPLQQYDNFHQLTQFPDKLFNNGAIQIFIRLLQHQSMKLKYQVSEQIFYIIQSALKYQTSISDCQLQFPIHFNHPYYDILNSDGSISAIEQILIKNQDNNLFSFIISQILAFLCVQHHINPSIQNKVINSLIDDIQFEANQFDCVLQSFHLLAQHKSNHQLILDQDIISYLYQESQADTDLSLDVIQLFLIMLERGSKQTCQDIKDIFDDEWFEKLIQRKNQIHLFDVAGNINSNLRVHGEKEQFIVNREAFALKSWFIEERKMKKIVEIKNQIDEEINNIKNLQGQQGQQFNLQENINLMISTINKIKDKELRSGATYLIRQSLYNYLFKLANNLNEQQIINGIQQLKDIIIEQNDQTIFCLIDQNICKCLQFFIQQSQKGGLSLLIMDKVVSLIVYLTERGVEMSSYWEQNNIILFNSYQYVNFAFRDIIDDEFIDYQDDEESIEIVNRIKLQAAIGYCCDTKFSSIDEDTLNTSILLLFNKLNQVVNYFEQYQQSLNDSNEEKNEEVDIDEDEQIIIRQILNAFSAIRINIIETLNPYIKIKLIQNIEQLIHINCGCPHSILLSNSQSITSLISSAFSAFSKIVYNLSHNQMIEYKLLHQNMSHFLQTVISFAQNLANYNSSLFQQYNLNNESNNSKLIDNIRLVRHSLKIIEIITNSMNPDRYQPFNEPNFINSLFKLIANKIISRVNEKEQSLITSYSLDIIHHLKREHSEYRIEKMLNRYNEMKVISRLMSQAGGCSNDYDDIISSCVLNLSAIYEPMHFADQNKIKLLNVKICIKMEEDGLYDEIDGLLFHSDSRDHYGVKCRVINISNLIIAPYKQKNRSYQYNF